ncbi:hypothetical protein [Streptomyces echinatus]|uniref:hypothetical protein n=1 Tax=Streptomyces echinatus TaxID=67293 RepID=UPI003CD05DE9
MSLGLGPVEAMVLNRRRPASPTGPFSVRPGSGRRRTGPRPRRGCARTAGSRADGSLTAAGAGPVRAEAEALTDAAAEGTVDGAGRRAQRAPGHPAGAAGPRGGGGGAAAASGNPVGADPVGRTRPDAEAPPPPGWPRPPGAPPEGPSRPPGGLRVAGGFPPAQGTSPHRRGVGR